MYLGVFILTWGSQRGVLFGLWLVAVVATGWLFFSEDRFFAARSLPLATIIKAENDVRYRADSEYRWTQVSKSFVPRIFEGDKIYTGEKSSVTLGLGDGRLIRVGPDAFLGFSMIMQKSGMTFIVNLGRGAVEVQNGKLKRASRRGRFPIIIRSDGKDYQVPHGEERLLVKDEAGVKEAMPVAPVNKADEDGSK